MTTGLLRDNLGITTLQTGNSNRSIIKVGDKSLICGTAKGDAEAF